MNKEKNYQPIELQHGVQEKTKRLLEMRHPDMSKQHSDMIQFSLQNSTKTYCPFRISSPAETPQCYKWLSYYLHTLQPDTERFLNHPDEVTKISFL